MKSLRRRGARQYHRYLRSGAWFARRRAWFTDHADKDRCVGCAVCRIRLTLATVQLHHVNYDGVSKTSAGRWQAKEHDQDLVAMCAEHHEALHVLFDRDPGWKNLGRKHATTAAIAKLQRELARALLELMEDQPR